MLSAIYSIHREEMTESMSDRQSSIEDGKRQMKVSRKVTSLSAALAMVSAILVTVAVTLALNASPASAATINWCHDPGLGGTFVCFNSNYRTGEVWQNYPNGTKQVFVSGLDHRLWTRWDNTNGIWSGWTSMGGKIAWNTTPGLFASYEYTWNAVVIVYGTDYKTYCRGRHRSGGWWPWQRCTPA
jgi:hypothetical protein